MKMAFDELPSDILYLLLRSAATEASPRDTHSCGALLSLAQASPSLYMVYSAYEPHLLELSLSHLTGPSYKLAIALARKEARLDRGGEIGDPESVSLHRSALRTFPKIARFARFFASRDLTNIYAGPHIRPCREPFTLQQWIQAAYLYAIRGIPDTLPPSSPLQTSDNSTARAAPPSVLMGRYISAIIRLADDDVRNAFSGLPGDREWCSWWAIKDPILRQEVARPGAWKEVGSILGVWEDRGLERWEETGEEDVIERGSKRWAYSEWKKSKRSMRVGTVVHWVDSIPAGGEISEKKVREPSAAIRFAIGFVKLKALIDSVFLRP